MTGVYAGRSGSPLNFGKRRTLLAVTLKVIDLDFKGLQLVVAFLDFDAVFAFEITFSFVPYSEFVFADWQIRDAELSVLVRYCGIRMINHHPVRLHPRMEVTRDFQWQRLADLVVNGQAFARWCVRSDQHVDGLVLERIRVSVVCNGVA